MTTRRLLSLAAVFTVAASLLSAGPAGAGSSDAVLNNFQLVGHDPLMNRGMNAALAVHGDYAYVGSRTDGKPWGGTQNLNNAGILVVDVSNPAAPKIVHQIGPPDQAKTDQTSREMRVWPQQDLLIVQNLSSNCSELIHMCAPVGGTPDVFTFYDISGANAAAPKKVLEFDPPSNPHEFFLWVDPFNEDRALLFVGPATENNRSLQVYDISGVPTGQPIVQVANAFTGIPSGGLHSIGITNDGMRAMYAHLTGGFVVADTSQVANGLPNAQVPLVTPSGQRVSWPGPGAHSAVKVPGKDVALVTDEVYGDALRPPVVSTPHGCPWGWARTIDISDPTRPVVAGQYRLPQNNETFCETDPPRPFSSWSAHNPTLTSDLAFISWHSGGLQAVSLADPANPTKAGEFTPDPVIPILQEDPVLSAGQDKVVVWSYPIIKDGLIYVVDVRNGLYILRYTGTGAEDVSSIDFLEGNSNLGDALRYEPPDPCDRDPVPAGYEEECEEQPAP